jgi:type I restriction enzyme S subunit
MITKQGLPKNWVLTDIETIRLDLHEGITPNKFPDQKFELYSVPQFEVGKPEIAYGKEVGSNKQVVASGTVLLCKINPRINRVWITGDHYSLKTICSTEWVPFFQLAGLNAKYLSYFLQNPIFREFLSINVSGVGGSLTRTKPSAFKDYPFPLAPLPEQNQIVAKIEELLSELDNGIENLKKACEQLKTYRQAVLKYAFEGKLTKEWRTQQIQAYKKQLEDWKKACEQAKKEGGKKPARPKKPKELPPLTEKELAELPELPEGWGWEQLKEITTVLGDGLHGTPIYSDEGDYYFINGNNLSDGKIEIKDNTKRVTFEGYEKYKKPLSENTVLVSINGTLGKTAFYNGERVILGKSACFFNVLNTIDKHYIRYCITSQRFINYAYKNATGSTIKNVSLKAMREFEIPIPPTREEQQAIVSEIESRLSVCDKIEQTIEDSIKKAEALRQSILKKAFTGELTRDWREKHPELITGENSAEKLLEKIKAEKDKLKSKTAG